MMSIITMTGMVMMVVMLMTVMWMMKSHLCIYNSSFFITIESMKNIQQLIRRHMYIVALVSLNFQKNNVNEIGVRGFVSGSLPPRLFKGEGENMGIGSVLVCLGEGGEGSVGGGSQSAHRNTFIVYANIN